MNEELFFVAHLLTTGGLCFMAESLRRHSSVRLDFRGHWSIVTHIVRAPMKPLLSEICKEKSQVVSFILS